MHTIDEPTLSRLVLTDERVAKLVVRLAMVALATELREPAPWTASEMRKRPVIRAAHDLADALEAHPTTSA
jgi:hypothetical protein